jgi:peptide/nickel transport system substrate-binding protein
MKRFSRFLMLGAAVALFGAALAPALAQGGPNEGGVIVVSNIGDDPKTFNPIISADLTSSTVHSLFYPTIIASDPVTLLAAPMADGGMAASWEYDETGTKLTLNLRQDLVWGDGTPITADDYLWAFNAVKSGRTTSPRTDAIYQLDDGTKTGGPIFDVTKIDDFTLEFTIGTADEDADGNLVGVLPNCVALDTINDIAVVPAHIYEAAFGSNYEEMDSDPYFVPKTEDGTLVTWGLFTDPFIEFGTQVSLLADQSYPDTQLGYVSPREWLMRQVANQNVGYERFLAGDFTYESISPNNQNDFKALDAGYQIIEYPSNGYTYMAYNTADPSNPQDALDENGQPIDQGLHPFFGDQAVRQALAYAIDVRSMIGTRPDGDQPGTGILQGNGYPIATHDHPGLSPVESGIEPVAFDPAKALELLAEAGWADNDGNGRLECNDCLYAREVDPAFNGTEFAFSLLTNAGNVNREATGETIKAQLDEIGITVNYQAIEFGTLVDRLLAQDFDTIIIGWSLGLPYNPGESILGLFGAGNDRVGAGFNMSSVNIPEMEDLLNEADSLPGCDPEERNTRYAMAMQMLTDFQPYLWLYATNVLVAAQPTVQGWDPLPYNAAWNLDAWTAGN